MGDVARRAQLHTEQEKIFTGVVASGNKSTVFIFKWRVFDFCLVVSKEKGSVQRHPDSSGLESLGGSSPGVPRAGSLNNTSYFVIQSLFYVLGYPNSAQSPDTIITLILFSVVQEPTQDKPVMLESPRLAEGQARIVSGLDSGSSWLGPARAC